MGCIYIERHQDIARYEQVFDRLLDSALNPQESIELIAKIAANYRSAETDAVRV